MVAPPREKMAVVWLTRFWRSCPWGSLTVINSLKVSSRVFLTRSAIISMALSRASSSHCVPPGRRYSALVLRSGLTASWKLAAPLGQSVPRLIGLSGLPSMLTILPSLTPTSMPQPTAQYGQTLGISCTPAVFRLCTRACVGRTSTRDMTPPTAKPPAESLRKLRRLREVEAIIGQPPCAMETYNHPYTQLRQDMHAWQCTWPMEQSNGVLNMDVGID